MAGAKALLNKVDLSDVDDWDEVKELVLESYRLIAPKRSLARLDA